MRLRLAVLASLAAIALLISAAPAFHSRAAAAAPFATNVRLTDGTTPYPQHVEPTLVVDSQGTLYAGWKEAYTHNGPGQRVAFARSTDGGTTWSANALMNTLSSGWLESDPWLVSDGSGAIHYARIEYLGNLTQSGVTVSSSSDGGRTWSTSANADDRPGFADKDSMAGDGNGSLYVAYDDILNSGGAGDQISLRVTRSTDGGATWSPTVQAADAAGNILGPVLAASANGTVHAAWWNLTDGNIMADTSRDHGATWGTDVRVNDASGSATPMPGWESSMPSVALDPLGRVYVAWADRGTGNLDILVSRSADDGASWSAPVRVNDNTTGDQWMPSLAVDPRGVVHAAWMDGRTGAWNVYYANSTDGGATWSANVRVTTAETPLTFNRPGDYLALATDANGSAYVAWTDGRTGSMNIYFATSAVPPEPPLPRVPPSFPWIELLIVVIVLAATAAVLAYFVIRRRRPRQGD